MLPLVILIEFACVIVYWRRWRNTWFFAWLTFHLARRCMQPFLPIESVALWCEAPFLILSTLAALEAARRLLPIEAPQRRSAMGTCAVLLGLAAAVAVHGFRLHEGVYAGMYVRPYLFAALGVGLLAMTINAWTWPVFKKWDHVALILSAWLLISVFFRLAYYADLDGWVRLNWRYRLTDCLVFGAWIAVEAIPACRAFPPPIRETLRQTYREF